MNSTPYLAEAKDVPTYRPGMTAAELKVAADGWDGVVVTMFLPAGDLGLDAEPEVYQALSKVEVVRSHGRAQEGDDAYVRVMSEAFTAAIDVCRKVGVIKW